MTVYNPTVGRMFLINLFGKKVGDDDPAELLAGVISYRNQKGGTL